MKSVLITFFETRPAALSWRRLFPAWRRFQEFPGLAILYVHWSWRSPLSSENSGWIFPSSTRKTSWRHLITSTSRRVSLPWRRGSLRGTSRLSWKGKRKGASWTGRITCSSETCTASKALLLTPPNFPPVGDLVEVIKDLGEERAGFAGRVCSEKGSLPGDSVFLPGFSVGDAVLRETL